MNNGQVNESIRPRKPLWRRALKRAIQIVVVLIFLIVAAGFTWNHFATRALVEEINKIRVAGEPLTFKQLADSHGKINPAEDAGPYYGAALELIRLGQRDDQYNQITGEFRKAIQEGRPGSDETLTAVRRFVDRDQLALQMMDHGAPLPGCGLDLGVPYGISNFAPGLKEAKDLTKIGSLKNELLALEGHGDEAAESMISSLRLSRVFDRQPMLINHLVKIACLFLCYSDMPLIVEHGRPSAEWLGKIEKALRDVEESIDLKRVFLGERIYCIALMGMGQLLPREDGVQCERIPEGAATCPAEWWSLPSQRTIAAAMLRTEARFITDVGKGFPEMLDGFQPEEASRWNPDAGVLEPSVKRAAELTAQALTRLRSTRVAIQIELFRKAHNRLPESLDELAAKMKVTLPEDPFTGKSLVYRKSGEGYLVYSVGKDKKDEPDKKLNSGEGSNWGIQIRK